MLNITKGYARPLFSPRPAWSHKGDFGSVLVIGGGRRYSGSPAFVALAAIRAGADLTLIAAPRRAADIAAGFGPDLITEPLDCDYLQPSETERLLRLAEQSDALVVGNGLDRREESHDAVRMLLERVKKPCVVDAEGLRELALHKGHNKITKRNFILTPHGNEFHALCGIKPSLEIRERAGQVKKAAAGMKATILLKGHMDVISDGVRTALNRTGNPWMTKGGTGDTLAGICGALLARGIRPFEAACAASWINGAAGDMALKEIGPGFLVSEMLDFIPKVIKGLI